MKCGGCARSIKNGLLTFHEISEVTVDIDHDVIEVTYDNNFSLEKIKDKLTLMGYPEKDTLTGFDKLAANARSYVSCAIG